MNILMLEAATTFEIVVAAIIVVVTIVALFFLYRNVAYEIQEMRKNKLAMQERDEYSELNEEEEASILLTSNSKKDMGLFALINHSIKTSPEGNLAAFYCINIDDFKNVTDGKNKKEVERLIQEIDRKLKKYGGKQAIAGHLSEDVFLFYYNGTIDAENINQVGADLINIIKEPIKGIEEPLSSAIGVTVFPYDGITADQLFKSSEVAVYVARKSGKNEMHMYSEDLIETEQNNINYYQEIKQSIQNDEFLLYYQAIVDVKTGKIIGLESLLRWNHPTKGILSPGKFLNVMELTGDITWFGTWGFEKTVMQYKNWRSKTRVGELFISTNLSPKQLEVPDLADQFLKITKKYGLSPELFCLEINDYYSIVANHNSLVNIAKFRKYGFRISIDDLGKDFDIIEDMKDLNASIIKLSRENVLLIMDQDDSVKSINHVIREAAERSKMVIAEGIENEEMIKKMYEAGVRFMQGYYFNEPKSVIEIESMVMKSPWNMDSFDHITGDTVE